MDLELHLVKSDNDVWGFRLTGGADYDVPFIVINVSENSIAEKSGLKCNDVIETINNISVCGFTHNETHNLLLTATNKLILGIKRGLTDIISPETCDSESNEEIANIMQASLQNQEQFEHERQEYYEIVNPLDQTKNDQGTHIVTAEPVLEKQTQLTQHKFLSDGKERKWSTFLQKPKHPVPVPKKLEDTLKVEPYRVVIKKQNRKDSLELKKKDKDKIETVILEEHHEQTRDSTVTPTKEVRFSDKVIEREKPEEEDEEEDKKKKEKEKEDKEEKDKEEEEEEKYEEEEEEKEEDEGPNGNLEEQCSKESGVIEQKIRSEETESEYGKDAQLEKMLEEKLLEVQKQLEALSKLPSTIQSTIDAVTKQLASIVSVRSISVTESEEKVLLETSSESESDLAEQIITEESNTSSEKEEDNLETDKNEEENKEKYEFRNDIEKNEHKIQNIEVNKELTEKEQLDAELMEKQEQVERIEGEFLEKQQKEREKVEEFMQCRLKQKPTLPLKPIERPIILPGGRRWSQPDDAYSSFRQSKMSDEKIANTIETHSEVIVGKTKGINFMKYQPPPKNLDYLQRSDVYKLVHHLEPPVRGIGSRAPKILSAQDYYQAG